MKGELDVELLRAETPGCMVSRFFNHSGASLPSTSTLSAITNHLERESLYGGMESAELVMPQVEKIRSDTDRDNFMDGPEAIAYGLIDKVLEKRPEMPVAGSNT